MAEIQGLGIDGAGVRALVPARRLVNLARYGMAAKAPRLRRHPPARRLATLLAAVMYLQAVSIDDCLELFDLLMVTELLGKAKRETDKQRAREHPQLERASIQLAAAVRRLLEASRSEQPVDLDEPWREIEQVVRQPDLEVVVAQVNMCGIAGRMSMSVGPVGHDIVEMASSVRRRGPNSTGFAVYGIPRESGLVVRVRLDDRWRFGRALDSWRSVTKEAGSDFAADPTWDDTTSGTVLVRPEIEDVGDVAATFSAIDPRPAHVQARMTTHTPDDGFVLGPLSGAEQATLMAVFSANGFKHATGLGEIAAKLAVQGGSGCDLDPFRVERFSIEPGPDAEQPTASLAARASPVSAAT